MRSKEHNYSAKAWYFVTTTTKHRLCYFGKVIKGRMVLNDYGYIAHEQWLWMSDYYDFVSVNKFVVMPNHVHAIIEIRVPYGTNAPRNLSQLVSAYKTRVSSRIRNAGLPHFSWHRSFHDHIIRSPASYNTIAEYIHYNPMRWNDDRYFNT